MEQRKLYAICQAGVWTMAVTHVFLGLAMLFAPTWFYANIGYFPPYNRHYLGDMGAFQLALGLGLAWAGRQPYAHRLFIGAVVLGNFLHTANHIYDDLLGGILPSSQTLLVGGGTLLFLLVLWALQKERATGS
jgi:hypothetical protein